MHGSLSLNAGWVVRCHASLHSMHSYPCQPMCPYLSHPCSFPYSLRHTAEKRFPPILLVCNMNFLSFVPFIAYNLLQIWWNGGGLELRASRTGKFNESIFCSFDGYIIVEFLSGDSYLFSYCASGISYYIYIYIYIYICIYIQGGSIMTGTELYVNKPRCAAAVRPWESEATTSTLPPARFRTCSVLSGSC